MSGLYPGDFLWPLISVFTVTMAALVILSHNAVYSALSLVLAFFGLATLYLLWGSPFLAVIQVLIYAGAIVVLFVFVVMTLNLSSQKMDSEKILNQWAVVLVGGSTGFLLALGLLRVLSAMKPAVVGTGISLVRVSELLFSQYLWPFEVLSLFLLALIVAVFVLARPSDLGDSAEYEEGTK